ncbi:hypothetical protein K0M31_004390, partial [Melipona bicolor]
KTLERYPEEGERKDEADKGYDRANISTTSRHVANVARLKPGKAGSSAMTATNGVP